MGVDPPGALNDPTFLDGASGWVDEEALNAFIVQGLNVVCGEIPVSPHADAAPRPPGEETEPNQESGQKAHGSASEGDDPREDGDVRADGYKCLHGHASSCTCCLPPPGFLDESLWELVGEEARPLALTHIASGRVPARWPAGREGPHFHAAADPCAPPLARSRPAHAAWPQGKHNGAMWRRAAWAPARPCPHAWHPSCHLPVAYRTPQG